MNDISDYYEVGSGSADARHGFREKLKRGMVDISNLTVRMTEREALSWTR